MRIFALGLQGAGSASGFQYIRHIIKPLYFFKTMSNIEEIKKDRIAGIKQDLAKYGIKGTTEVLYNHS